MSPAVRGLVHGALLATSELRRRGAFAIGATLASALIVGLVERALGPIGALDRALGLTATWILPLGAAAIVTSILGLRTPRDMAWPVARYGAPRLTVGVGILAVTVIAVALTTALSSALVVVSAHSSAGHDAPLAGDAVTSAGVSALVGAAYAAMLFAGATFGRRGGGRAILLALDFVIGGLGVVGYALPRIHGQSLLGVEVAALSQKASSVVLLVLVVVWGALGALRSRD